MFHVTPHHPAPPYTSPQVKLHLGHWGNVLNETIPSWCHSGSHTTTLTCQYYVAMRHFARASALASLDNCALAVTEQSRFIAAITPTLHDHHLFQIRAGQLLDLAAAQLQARLALRCENDVSVFWI